MTACKIELFAPAIMLLEPELSLDIARIVALANALIAGGAHGLPPFGITCEANSLSEAECVAALKALVDAGIDPSQLIPGTGCCAATDTITLPEYATGLEYHGVLMLLRFFCKSVSDAGPFDACAQVITVDGSDLPVCFCRIPQMSGVPVTLHPATGLIAAFSNQIAGKKNSSGKWDNTVAVIAAFPQIDTCFAFESMIPENVAAGGAGGISARSSVNPSGIRVLTDGLGGSNHDAQHSDPTFVTVRPPFTALGPDHADAIAYAVRITGPQG